MCIWYKEAKSDWASRMPGRPRAAPADTSSRRRRAVHAASEESAKDDASQTIDSGRSTSRRRTTKTAGEQVFTPFAELSDSPQAQKLKSSAPDNLKLTADDPTHWAGRHALRPRSGRKGGEPSVDEYGVWYYPEHDEEEEAPAPGQVPSAESAGRRAKRTGRHTSHADDTAHHAPAEQPAAAGASSGHKSTFSGLAGLVAVIGLIGLLVFVIFFSSPGQVIIQTPEATQSLTNLVNSSISSQLPSYLQPVEASVSQLRKELDTTQSELSSKVSSLESRPTQQLFDDLQRRIDSLETRGIPNSGSGDVGSGFVQELSKRLQKLETSNGEVNELKHRLESLEGALKGQDYIQLKGRIDELAKLPSQEKYDDLKTRVDQMKSLPSQDTYSKLEGRVKSLEERPVEFGGSAELNDKVISLAASVGTFESRIESSVKPLREELSSLNNRLNNLPPPPSVGPSQRVGKADYALFAQGGRYVPSLTGTPKDASGSSGGISSWFDSILHESNPNVALDDNMTPGSCWHFNGATANFTVQLYCPIIASAFTIDHIPYDESVSPGSMPKAFTVYGRNSTTHEVMALVSGEYNSKGLQAQTFDVTGVNRPPAFDQYTLQIKSNYQASYTCLYRFRVHGSQVHNHACQFH